MVDLHAEAGRQIEGHVDVGRRDRIADAEGGVRGGERQSHQQARNELRRHGTVDEGFAAAQGAADLDRQPPPAVRDARAQPPERSDHRLHRAGEQRAAAFDADRRGAERRDRSEEPCGKARFAYAEHVAARSEAALDREDVAGRAGRAGAERLDAAQGRARVVAESDVAQLRAAVREQRGGQCALGVTFRTGRCQFSPHTPGRDRHIHKRFYLRLR